MNPQDTASERRALQQRIDDLELRLREADHRIANSLQLASAMARHPTIDSGETGARARLVEIQRCVDAIAGVHQLLSEQPDAIALSMPDYLWRLVGRLQGGMVSGGLGPRIRLNADPLHLPPEIAVWLGMVVGELVGNACKYGFDGVSGEVRLSLTAEGSGFRLEVANDGPGLDPEAPPQGSGLGGRMIRALADRLGGEFHYRRQARGVTAIFIATALVSGAV